MQYGNRLTAPDGSPTGHIRILFANITEFGIIDTSRAEKGLRFHKKHEDNS